MKIVLDNFLFSIYFKLEINSYKFISTLKLFIVNNQSSVVGHFSNISAQQFTVIFEEKDKLSAKSDALRSKGSHPQGS